MRSLKCLLEASVFSVYSFFFFFTYLKYKMLMLLSIAVIVEQTSVWFLKF